MRQALLARQSSGRDVRIGEECHTSQPDGIRKAVARASIMARWDWLTPIGSPRRRMLREHALRLIMTQILAFSRILTPGSQS